MSKEDTLSIRINLSVLILNLCFDTMTVIEFLLYIEIGKLFMGILGNSES